jgi:formamidopyrimidine-DNA glycosylase
MPELPEVEGLAGFLRERAVGRAVVGVEVGAVSALKTFAPAPEALAGRVVAAVTRHGKWLDLLTRPAPGGDEDTASELHLVLHLAKAGWLRWYDAAPTRRLAPGRSAVALRVRLSDGSGFDLTEAGTRKRLAVHVVARAEDVPAIATLGIEPLGPGFTPEALASLLAARNQQVKGLLRDQSTIAGIGNAYSDEILHAAKESPFALTGSFDAERTARLHAAIGEVLRPAVAAASGRPAAELKDAKRAGMRVHGRAGLPCPVCGDEVREVSFADSFLNYCPTCQTGGKPLADRRMSRLLR